MRLIVESAGGHLLNPEEEPHEFRDKLIIICDDSERRLQKRMEDKGFKCFSPELILTGVMRQRLQFNQFEIHQI